MPIDDRRRAPRGARPPGQLRRAARWTLAVLLGTLLLSGMPAARAQNDAAADDVACEEELNAAYRQVAGQPNGLAAAFLLRTAVELLEPALPPNPGVQFPERLAPYPDAAWLHQRRLLPAQWRPATLDPAAWRDALDRLRRRYALDGAETENASAPRALVFDLSRTLADLRAVVRPLGVIASDGDRVAFNAIIWNYTPYPRLLVLRPPEGAVLMDGPQAALAALSTCARPVVDYVTAPAGAALDLFLSAPETTLILLASVPSEDARWPIELSRDEAPAVFAYEASLLDGVDAVSVAFEGPSMSLGSVLAFLPRMEGTVGPFGIGYYLEFPR